MASSALRRSLPRRTSLRRSIPPHLPPAVAGAFRRSFQSGDGESLEEFDERLFGSKGAEQGSLYEKLDRNQNATRRYGMGSGMGGFPVFGDRSSVGSSSMGGFPGFSDRSSSGSSMGGLGDGESLEEFDERLFGSKGAEQGSLYEKLDRNHNATRRYGMGSGMGSFPGFSDRSSSGSPMGGFPGFGDRSSSGSSSMGGFPGFSDRSSSGSSMGGLGVFSDRGGSGSMGFFDSSNDGITERLGDAARSFQMDDDDDDDDDEWEEDDFEFRPDVQYRRGSTYSVRDLDLTRPAAAKNPPRPQFETTTAEVLKKADFRNVRFLSRFLTEAGIIIKRSQTRISAKAQRKIAREIKTARAFGLMPFTTMGRRPFIFGRSAEEHYSEEEYFGFGKPIDAEPVEDNGDEEPNVEAA